MSPNCKVHFILLLSKTIYFLVRATVVVIGALYERLGRLVGRSYEETIQLLLKTLKNADAPMRCEIMFTLERIVNGLGSAGGNIHREIFKVAKTHLCDRAMPVRSSAAMVVLKECRLNGSIHLRCLVSDRFDQSSQLHVHHRTGEQCDVGLSSTGWIEL